MGVASHLRIDLNDYDQRIRTFVPDYETMLTIVAGALRHIDAEQPTVVDLGIGTGALSAACLDARPDARILGIDSDAGMLDAARRRLRDRPAVTFQGSSFLDGSLPQADAFVACISLHHILEPDVKQAFYARVYRALNPGGMLLCGDCFPGRAPALARRHREAWLAHLEQSCSAAEAEAYLQAWSEEDVYFPLETELAWLREVGFAPEVLWRHEGFAVVAALRGPPTD